MTPETGSGEERARLFLPQLRLDDLLTELQARLGTARATRGRVHALLEAVVTVGGELDLETVLRRITEAAAALAGARYGALGVIGQEGERLAQFVTVGMSENEIATIGNWPHGHGILGLLIKEPSPLRLADIAAHPESYGFPAGHPVMRSFLGVPIRIRDEVFGNLYLTGKAGGGEFEEEDEIVVSVLAAAAGVAIENARLYEETRRREQWLTASGEISTALLSGGRPGEVLELVVRRAREICDATHAGVMLADAPAGEFFLAVVDGPYADELRGLRAPIDDKLLGPVFRNGEPRFIAAARESTMGTRVPEHVPLGAALLVPLGMGQGARGVLGVIYGPGAPPFTESMHRLLEAYAGQAAVAFEVAERRRDAERLGRLEDRERIAKDLHDTVIQQLFATAMTLMTAVKITRKQDVSVRVQRAVDDLDDTIRQIRSTIFRLQSDPGEQGLRARLHEVVDAAVDDLGFTPAVRLDGLLDTVVDGEVGESLLAALAEALSNVARHAGATRAIVVIDIGGRELVMSVEDDGAGILEGAARGGLRTMAERAERLGGKVRTGPGEDGGTLLVWQVPIVTDEAWPPGPPAEPGHPPA